MNELARVKAGVEAAKSALDGDKAGRESKVGVEREREKEWERERAALCAQILETENEMARIQRELQGRRKAERELDGDIEAAKALVYGAGLLKEANEGWVGIAYDKRKEFCKWRWLDAPPFPRQPLYSFFIHFFGEQREFLRVQGAAEPKPKKELKRSKEADAGPAGRSGYGSFCSHPPLTVTLKDLVSGICPWYPSRLCLVYCLFLLLGL